MARLTEGASLREQFQSAGVRHRSPTGTASPRLRGQVQLRDLSGRLAEGAERAALRARVSARARGGVCPRLGFDRFRDFLLPGRFAVDG